MTLERYTAVDDVGTGINPMIVEGQLTGGIVQGIGQALYEHGVYDAGSGQLLAGSFMDSCMPRADDFPEIVVKPHGTVCAHTPMGVKGCGECGTIGSPAAVINAVVDALGPLGVTRVDMPATPAQPATGVRLAPKIGGPSTRSNRTFRRWLSSRRSPSIRAQEKAERGCMNRQGRPLSQTSRGAQFIEFCCAAALTKR